MDMARVAVKCAAFLVVLVLMMESASRALGSDADVNIYNDIQGEAIQVHCKGNHDLGEKTILSGQHFGWGFTPSIWGTTKYRCTFTWGIRGIAFYVWVDDGFLGVVTIRPCTHCVYRVGREGISRVGRNGNLLFIHGWQ